MDPYKVLGVSTSATDDEVKKAYKTLAKKYHPDMHVGSPDQKKYEALFKQVQEAYNLIMQQRQGGGMNGFGGFGQSQQNYGGQGFGGFGQDFGGFGNAGYGGASGAATGNDARMMQAAETYINASRFGEALNVLNSVSAAGRSAHWHYLAALANAGLGNNMAARELARRAVSMDPNVPEYRFLWEQLANGGSWYSQRSTTCGGRPSVGGSNLCCTIGLLYMLGNCCCCCGNGLR